MALHPDFPDSPHAILDPGVRWFPADEALRETSMEKLIPPLVANLRRKVKEFRDSGYVGASDTSKSLLNWWFGRPHLLPTADGGMVNFQYYFAQRESLETIVYLYDVVGAKDKFDLMRFDAGGAVSAGMFDESWRRYVVKMATGSGKTKVMSLALAWSFFHRLYEPDSELSRNFLLITPNIIVLDRIYKDFQGLRIFFEDPVLPDNGVDGRNWRDDFQLTLHLQDEVRVVRPAGNIFLTNNHRVYSGEEIPPSPDNDNTMDYFLGKRPTGATTDSKVDLGMIVRDIDELMILNDEAHHIHDARLAWFKSIEDIHNRLLQKGSSLSLQMDVTATPKHNNGAIFVQTVADYPLVEAISQNVVKHPVLADPASRAKLAEQKSAKFTKKYADYLDLGVIEWRKAMGEGTKPKTPLVIEVDHQNPQKDIDALDIEIPVLTPRVYRNYKNLAEINMAVMGFEPTVYRQFEQEKLREIVFKYTAKENEIHHTTVLDGAGVGEYRSVIGFFAQTIMKELRLVSGYDVLYGKVKGFLEQRNDVSSWTKNYFSVHFKLAYVNADGDISNYYPDFIVKLTKGKIVVVETKGLEDLDVPPRMARLAQWCDDMNDLQSKTEYDFVFVGDEEFKKYHPRSFVELLKLNRQYKTGRGV